jgi:PAS domain S-box-containing protein
MKILIVEDKAESLYMLETLLKGSGYEVVSAKNGLEALEQLKKDTIEMIISDILMPKMDGFQLCRACKRDDTVRNIPFVFYTATYTDKKDEEFALSLGAEKFIIKPVDPDMFLKILEGVIEEHRKGVLVAPKKPIEKEEVYLAEYNKRLIHKLEKKMLDLENANKELKESEQKYRELIENANDAVIVIEPTGYLGFVNPKFCETTGYKMEEAKKFHFSKLVHPEDLAMVTENFRKRLAGVDVPRNYEFRALIKSGETIYVDYNASLIEREGKTVGIQAIMRDITERKRTEEQIKTSLKEKGVMLKEIHHRVKNNLQVISSLLSLQSRHIKDKEVLALFKDSQSRIYSMSLIHESLYQSEDLARIDFAGYVRTLTRDLFRSYSVGPNDIKLNMEIKDVFLDVNTGIPCGLIINELVTNSLRYGFPDGKRGEIQIGLYERKNGEFTLNVRDNGIGFPEDLDFRNTESLGMQIVLSLVEQLDGTIELDRSEGTTFKIVFEKAK